MKLFFTFLSLFLVQYSFSQFGSLKYQAYIEGDMDGVIYTTTMTSGTTNLVYKDQPQEGTIDNIPVGTYETVVTGLNHSYSTSVDILEGKTTDLYVTIDEYTEFYEEPLVNEGEGDDYLAPAFVNVAWQFGTGIPLTSNPEWHNSFDFSYSIGPDFRLGNSPVALGYEIGLAYQQTNFGTLSFSDSTILVDRQSFSNFSLPISFMTSFYAKNRKILDFGIKYNVPLIARVVEKSGDTKLKTRNVHYWNDVRFFAHLGYWWGFVYAEYRPVKLLKAAYPNTPDFNVGVRLMIPLEM